ncbi:ParB/RepB/Spo0J family partition protein [Corallococcus sp. AB038B]|uniref:ParB/RepB/Spo0J family partition protein n=1 Tax=Corallococcus sp. AB038B TaxID=2316718 RepID=UPI000EED973B|nr:ParB/RepB/Spo0J family partition protein [Corallococcus sp. AB038B]RKH93582.1 hypothetical protein D7Y04_39955 [Corallococcus sp. AB038B]
MGVVMVRIDSIIPPHEVRDDGKLAALRESMEENGWQGRPLLGVPHPSAVGAFLALTGSHRTAAAQEAGLEEVPLYVAQLGGGIHVHESIHGDSLRNERDNPIEQEDLADYLRPWDPGAAALAEAEDATNAAG